MSNKLYVELNTIDFKKTVSLNITFVTNSLIFVKLDNKFKLAKIVDTYDNKIYELEVAKLIVLEDDYPNVKLFTLDINDKAEFFYVDKTLIDKDILNILNSNSLEKAEAKIKKLVDKRTEELNGTD